MKRLLNLFFVGMIAIMASSCETNEPADNSQLATPEISLHVEGNSIIVTWGKIAGAAYYEVTINPGETAKTDQTTYRFDNLEFNTEYTVSVKAISPEESKSSESNTKSIKTAEHIVPQYREWYSMYSAAPQAISNNGQYVVGANDRMGFWLNLSDDTMIDFQSIELYDVADNGIAVGSDHTENPDGNAVMYVDGQMVAIDLTEFAVNYGMSCATGITPDGEYVVGWYWEYDESCYYAQQYGMVIPFCYDVAKKKVSVPEVGQRLYNESYATAIWGVAPDRSLLGYEQTVGGIQSIVWADEYTPFEYVFFEYDSEYNPTFGFGDTQNRLSQEGRYIYGKAVDYSFGETSVAAAYDRQTKTLMTFTGGSVTAMTDSGIAFLNDVPYYIGTTSYVIDTTKGEPYAWSPLEEWLKSEHNIDVASFEPTTDTDPESELVLEGIIVVGVSEDGSKILGMTNTDMGWMTFVVDLNGVPATAM